MAKDTYTPHEVCQITGVSRTTLFRWEAEGQISPPPERIAQRQATCEGRIYTKEQGRLILEKCLKAEYARAARQKNSWMKDRIDEKSAVKRFHFGDEAGLEELKTRQSLLPETCLELVHIAEEYGPQNLMFRQILKLIIDKT